VVGIVEFTALADLAINVLQEVQPWQQAREFNFSGRNISMNNTLLKLYIKMQNLLSQDEGQDLVEYALVVALIALAATAGMGKLASGINLAFSSIGTTLSADV